MDVDQTSYRILVGCTPFHPARAECFLGTGVCLSCSIRTSIPRSDEASESHAIGLDQTCQSKNMSRRSHNRRLLLLHSKAKFHIPTRKAVFLASLVWTNVVSYLLDKSRHWFESKALNFKHYRDEKSDFDGKYPTAFCIFFITVIVVSGLVVIIGIRHFP